MRLKWILQLHVIIHNFILQIDPRDYLVNKCIDYKEDLTHKYSHLIRQKKNPKRQLSKQWVKRDDMAWYVEGVSWWREERCLHWKLNEIDIYYLIVVLKVDIMYLLYCSVINFNFVKNEWLRHPVNIRSSYCSVLY